MDEGRASDISKTQMDLVDLSGMEESPEEDSLHPIGPKGFCVKEYEELMQALKKENFNLKLRIYFLEEKNPNIPEGAETLYKQNIDLKIENETLMKDLQEKQDLLCQASKALELLDDQKGNDLQHSQMMIEELNQKIESLQHEVSSLQNALVDANKSVLANDTGYADFLGAVDTKDVEVQRKLMELTQVEANFNQQMVEMNQKMKELHQQKREIETKASSLLYENDEMKDKMSSVEQQMNDQTSKLETDLNEYKVKWASAQCDLQDTVEKLKATEHEREKTLSLLKSSLVALEEKRVEVINLENQVAESRASGMNKDRAKNGAGTSSGLYDKLLMNKDNKITELSEELIEVKRHIQQITNNDLMEKNREIEKLKTLLNNMQVGRNSLTNRFSLEQLSDSFNDLKYQQSMLEKKKSQQKIDEVLNELAVVANTKTKEHVAQLQQQMSIYNEKQEVTDDALGKCAELCAFTLDHLHELAQFLSALLQQKEIRESLSEMTMFNIQSAIDKTFEFSNQAGRFSVDGRLSSFPDISSLDILMTSARQSMANIKELQHCNKSVQASYDENSAALQSEVEAVRKELEDINRVNQVLEDEICRLKEAMNDYKLKLDERDAEVVDLKAVKENINSKFQEAQQKIKDLHLMQDQLEQKLQNETLIKMDFESRATKSESLSAHLTQKLELIHEDLEANWITTSNHNSIVKRLEDEVINGEAQVAAVRLQMESLRISLENEKTDAAIGMEQMSNALDPQQTEESKENFNQQSTLRTLEISDERKRLLASNGDSAVSSSTDPACAMCPKYQAKIVELKKYLTRAMEKIKFQTDVKVQNDRHIQKQLSNTESFLSKARSNMENILKNRNSNQD